MVRLANAQVLCPAVWLALGLLAGFPPGPAAAQAHPDPPPLDESLIDQLLDPTQIIAQVGDLPIMAADLLPTADQMLQPYIGKVPEDALRRQAR